jgi:hypothetical protein
MDIVRVSFDTSPLFSLACPSADSRNLNLFRTKTNTCVRKRKLTNSTSPSQIALQSDIFINSCIWVGRQKVQFSSPGRVKNFLFSMSSRLVQELTVSYQMGTGVFFTRRYSGRSVKLTNYIEQVPRYRKVDLYFNSPIRIHGVMLN